MRCSDSNALELKEFNNDEVTVYMEDSNIYRKKYYL